MSAAKPTRCRALAFTSVIAVATLVLASCGSSMESESQAGSDTGDTIAAAPPSTSVTDGRPRTITTFVEPFVDTSRPTQPSTDGAPASEVRALPTTVYLPSGTGRGPLVVFSHGLGGSPEKFTRLHTAWAEAGYVVAAPSFPLTNDSNPNRNSEAADLVNQPADVSFVLDQLLAADQDPASPLFARIDTNHLGAAGLSLGGATTYGVIFNDCCADQRFSAAMVMAGAALIATPSDYTRSIPTLVFHGDADPVLRYELGRSAWELLPGPTWLITLPGAPHSQPFENTVTEWDELVFATSTAFWDATLGADDTALPRMTDQVATAPDLAVIESR